MPLPGFPPRRWCAVAAAALVALSAAGSAHGATVLSAGPTPDPGDGRTAHGFAVTFSPDADGRNDVVEVRVRGERGARYRLVAATAGILGAETAAGQGPTGRVGPDGTATLRWRGRDGRRALSDGPYLLRVCSAAGGCLPTTIAAHLRIVAASIRTPTGFAPGADVPLDIAADVPEVTIGVAPDTAQHDTPLIGPTTAAPGRSSYRLPADLTPGLYRLVVTTGQSHGWRALPLIVHGGDLTHPAPGTTLVVLPQFTWSVYNRYDADRDGLPDSHYTSPSSRRTRLTAPYETPGLTAPGRAGREQDTSHTAGFTRTWRLLGGAEELPSQFVTDAQLEQLPNAVVRRYAAMLFLGHTEYATRRLFDRVRAYQLGGGDFLYTSANGFYALVARSGDGVRLIARPYRTATVNDALITGAQYTGCCWSVGSPGPLLVTREGLRRAPWAFRGTGLRAGDVLTYAGGEIDGFGPQAPAGMLALASIDWRAPDPPQSAAMVLLRRPGGGRVFAGGTMGLIGGTARNAVLRRVLGNVWAEFARR